MSREKEEEISCPPRKVNDSKGWNVEMLQMTVSDKSPEVDHLKKVFKKYFQLDATALRQIFTPKRLIVTELFRRFKKYFKLSEPLFLNYLVILEFINLAQLEHHEIGLISNSSNLKVNSEGEEAYLIDKQLVRQILSGDLFVILAIQEINQLAKSSASYFFAIIKQFYDRKVQTSIVRMREARFLDKSKDGFNSNSKNSLLKFILFLNFQDNNTKINSFYQSFVRYLDLLESLKKLDGEVAEVHQIKNEVVALEEKLIVRGEALSEKKFTFPVDELLGLVKNPQVYPLIEKLV